MKSLLHELQGRGVLNEEKRKKTAQAKMTLKYTDIKKEIITIP